MARVLNIENKQAILILENHISHHLITPPLQLGTPKHEEKAVNMNLNHQCRSMLPLH